MPDETMNYPEAIRLVLRHGARVRRLGWDTKAWRDAYDYSDGTRVWIGALTGKMFGIESGPIYDFSGPLTIQGEACGETGFRLYQVRHPPGSGGFRHVNMDWEPSLSDALADDWVAYDAPQPDQ